VTRATTDFVKIVAVTRIGNEADIAEAFVRHTSALVDHHILMLDGSIDDTRRILRSLRDAGLPLTLLEATSVRFSEAELATALYRLAVEAGADWVVYLDTDEFIDVRGLGQSLRGYLREFAWAYPDISCIRVRLADYLPTSRDDPAEPVVANRIGHRRAPADNTKVIVKGDLLHRQVEVQAGNHHVLVDGGQPVVSHLEERLLFAHYQERSVYQWLAKAVVGWAKVLAAGEAAVARGWASHYRGPFEVLIGSPDSLLRNQHFMGFRHDSEELVHDPIAYLGGELAFTRPADDPVAAVRTVLNYLSNLATEYGRFAQSRPPPPQAQAEPAADVEAVVQQVAPPSPHRGGSGPLQPRGDITAMIEHCPVHFEGRQVAFAVANRHDIIQGRHASGAFYEIEQLIAHRNLIWYGASVLDIGANVGNHSIFYAMFSKALAVYPFEPNPNARRLLLESVRLNHLHDRVRLDYAELAVGAASGEIGIGEEIENNLGATYMTARPPDGAGRLARCVALDDLAIPFRVSFVKLDIEGWELAALEGAKGFIAAQRPAMAIEVNEHNERGFWRWVDEANYAPIGCYQDTDAVKTYVMIPRA
jgi:FkbM family methyltransferase